MTFSEFKAHSEPLFKQLEILKFRDSIAVNNCLFVHDYFNNDLPLSFSNIFKIFFRRNRFPGSRCQPGPSSGLIIQNLWISGFYDPTCHPQWTFFVRSFSILKFYISHNSYCWTTGYTSIWLAFGQNAQAPETLSFEPVAVCESEDPASQNRGVACCSTGLAWIPFIGKKKVGLKKSRPNF